MLVEAEPAFFSSDGAAFFSSDGAAFRLPPSEFRRSVARAVVGAGGGTVVTTLVGVRGARASGFRASGFRASGFRADGGGTTTRRAPATAPFPRASALTEPVATDGTSAAAGSSADVPAGFVALLVPVVADGGALAGARLAREVVVEGGSARPSTSAAGARPAGGSAAGGLAGASGASAEGRSAGAVLDDGTLEDEGACGLELLVTVSGPPPDGAGFAVTVASSVVPATVGLPAPAGTGSDGAARTFGSGLVGSGLAGPGLAGSGLVGPGLAGLGLTGSGPAGPGLIAPPLF